MKLQLRMSHKGADQLIWCTEEVKGKKIKTATVNFYQRNLITCLVVTTTPSTTNFLVRFLVFLRRATKSFSALLLVCLLSLFLSKGWSEMSEELLLCDLLKTTSSRLSSSFSLCLFSFSELVVLTASQSDLEKINNLILLFLWTLRRAALLLL